MRWFLVYGPDTEVVVAHPVDTLHGSEADVAAPMRIRIRNVIDHRAVDLGRDLAAGLQNADPLITVTALVRQAAIGGQHVRARIPANTVAVLFAILDRTLGFVPAPV